ncbi:MAG: DUF6624 domain-containing protein [Bacteroidota bacterium]
MNKLHHPISPIFIFLATTFISFQNMAQEIPYDSLSERLVELYDLDQAKRMKLFTNQVSEEEKPGFLKKLIEQDALNQREVIQILDTYGWLPLSAVGEKAATSLFLVIQHADVAIMEKYYPLIKVQAEQQEANPMYVAMMQDRILMYQGKRQIYGSQASSRPSSNNKGKESFIWPIEDPDGVNERRKAVGFPMTVEENADRLGAIFNPEEPLPPKDK